MSAPRVLGFVREFQDLTRTAANEAELRDLKMERERQDVRRNRVIIEFKDRGLFLGRADSAKFEEARQQLTEKYIPQQVSVDGRPESDYITNGARTLQTELSNREGHEALLIRG